MSKRCGNCRFFEPDAGNLKQGLCRAQPPIVRPIPVGPNRMRSVSCWPPVKAHEWCGQHQPRIVGEATVPLQDNDGKEKPKDA